MTKLPVCLFLPPTPSLTPLSTGGPLNGMRLCRWTTQLRVLVLLARTELSLTREVWPSPYDEQEFSDLLSRAMRLLIQQVRGMSHGPTLPGHVVVVPQGRDIAEASQAHNTFHTLPNGPTPAPCTWPLLLPPAQGRDIVETKRSADKVFVLLDMKRHLRVGGRGTGREDRVCVRACVCRVQGYGKCIMLCTVLY